MSIFIEGHESRSDKENLSMKWFRIIFGTKTKSGKLFDVILLWAILISVALVMVESVPSIRADHKQLLIYLEYFFTALFTLEYLLRIAVVRKPLKYITSFYGIIDLLSIIPSYLGIILTGGQHLMVIRMLRLLRVFRVLKLMRYLRELRSLGDSLMNSRRKIAVFLLSVFTLTVIFGTIMYMIESEKDGFTSIPRSIYWAIVTLTTVGYGDIAPQTVLGQLLASMIMLFGYAIIAVPTGLVTADLVKGKSHPAKKSDDCPRCGTGEHLEDSRFCRICGKKLVE